MVGFLSTTLRGQRLGPCWACSKLGYLVKVEDPCMSNATSEDEAFVESSRVNYEGVTKSGSEPEDNNYLTEDSPRS